MEILIMINIIGTTLGLMFGKHGKRFLAGTRNKTWYIQGFEMALYYAIASVLWLPTLPIRFVKNHRLQKAPQMSQAHA